MTTDAPKASCQPRVMPATISGVASWAIARGDTVYVQRREVARASDSPLSAQEQIIIDLCDALASSREAVLEERERCAKVCDRRVDGWGNVEGNEYASGRKREAMALAIAIRARACLDDAKAVSPDCADWLAAHDKMHRMEGALKQASLCLRELLPNDPDAQMSVRLIDKALAAQSKPEDRR